MSFYVVISLFLSALLGGLSVYLLKRSENIIKLLLAFSGSYLLAISVLHLIPEIYSGNSDGHSIGIYILLGFFLQVLLETFSGGIEHGHVHTHENTNSIPIAVFISLCFHAFAEGMPLGTGALESQNLNTLLLGILIHKIPIAFVLMSFMIHANVKFIKALAILVIFSAMAPLGSITGQLSESINLHSDKLIALVVGIFLHVSTTILFESSANHRFNLYKFIIIIFGAGLAFISL